MRKPRSQQLKRDLRVLKASNEREIDAAFASIARQPGSAVMIATDPYFFAGANSLLRSPPATACRRSTFTAALRFPAA